MQSNNNLVNSLTVEELGALIARSSASEQAARQCAADQCVSATQTEPPRWLTRKPNGAPVMVNSLFVEEFAKQHDVRCVGGRFYLGDTQMRDEFVKKEIYIAVRPHIESSAQKVTSLLALLAIETECEAPRVEENCIYFKNCTVELVTKGIASAAERACKPDGQENPAPTGYMGQSAIVGDGSSVPPHSTEPTTTTLRRHPAAPVALCRVPHNFDPTVGEPTQFIAFLETLFQPDDIPTIQEYLGYCLLPNTKAQKALFIIGRGGEGKSRLTVLMQKVLGSACVVSSVGRISDRFFGIMLEHKLLFMDDDLCCDKFNATDAFKTLVTNETDVLVEPKGKPHYEIRPYTKFLLMGNQSVGSLHDRSEGFYRRVHIINVKRHNKNRVHNPDIIQEIWAAEQQEIILWLVKGALKLARQNYCLTESAASRAEIKALKRSDNTALEFLQEQTFIYTENAATPSSQLTGKYREWCYDHDLFRVSGQVFKQTCEQFFAPHGVVYTKKTPSHVGQVRGYKGVMFG